MIDRVRLAKPWFMTSSLFAKSNFLIGEKADAFILLLWLWNNQSMFVWLVSCKLDFAFIVLVIYTSLIIANKQSTNYSRSFGCEKSCRLLRSCNSLKISSENDLCMFLYFTLCHIKFNTGIGEWQPVCVLHAHCACNENRKQKRNFTSFCVCVNVDTNMKS